MRAVINITTHYSLGFLILCSIYSLMGMEQASNKHSVHLKLDGIEKTYSIARWKVIQESYQAGTINVSGMTEQEVIFFDEELDKIDLKTIEKNDDALKKEIKKKIILYHLPAYKKVFDYLLVSMIADNIRNNCVKTEKAYSFEPKSVKKVAMGDLYIPPIDKLGQDTFRGKSLLRNNDVINTVITFIPLSTMLCMGMNTEDDTSCVKIYNNKVKDNYLEYIGTVPCDQKNINGLGLTTDLRYLVTTFDNMLVSKTELYSDNDFVAYKGITNNIQLIDIYLLLQLYKAKKQGRRAELQDNEYNYIRDNLASDAKGKELIQKHFF